MKIGLIVTIGMLLSSVAGAQGSAPTPPTSTIASTHTLAWDPPSDQVTGYRLLYGNVGGGPYPQTWDVGNTTQTPFPLMTPGIPYFFVVEAYNGSGISSPSNEVTFTQSLGSCLAGNIQPGVTITSYDPTGIVGTPLSVIMTGTGCVIQVRTFLSKDGVSGVTSQIVGFPEGVDFGTTGHIVLHPTLMLPGIWHVYAEVTDNQGRVRATGLIRVVTVTGP